MAEAQGDHAPAYPVWEREGRFYDALRPNVDPEGHASALSVVLSREDHLAAVRQALAQVRVLILTLGLNETWEDPASGTVYPTAPGVIADPPPQAKIRFLSLGHDDVVADLRAILTRLRRITPEVKVVLTVAPGPLVATAGGQHVLPASAACKAVLRAAADTLTRSDPQVDYFPSYEIVTNPAARSAFFQPNLRLPTPKAISVVMKQFLGAHQATQRPVAPTASPVADADPQDNAAICEEQMHDPGLRVPAANGQPA
ncbi:MAG: GSCFA domain-containing protein [Mycobacterium sp.]|nr:GSCFA domain-containing protein [Mycobacterium sp.]